MAVARDVQQFVADRYEMMLINIGDRQLKRRDGLRAPKKSSDYSTYFNSQKR